MMTEYICTECKFKGTLTQAYDHKAKTSHGKFYVFGDGALGPVA